MSESEKDQDLDMKDEEPKKTVKMKEFVSTQEAKMVPKNLFVDSLQTCKLIESNEDDQEGPSQNIAPNDGVQLMQLKLPSSVRFVSKRFDEENYEIENEIKFKNDVSVGTKIFIISIFMIYRTEWSKRTYAQLTTSSGGDTPRTMA